MVSSEGADESSFRACSNQLLDTRLDYVNATLPGRNFYWGKAGIEESQAHSLIAGLPSLI